MRRRSDCLADARHRAVCVHVGRRPGRRHLWLCSGCPSQWNHGCRGCCRASDQGVLALGEDVHRNFAMGKGFCPCPAGAPAPRKHRGARPGCTVPVVGSGSSFGAVSGCRTVFDTVYQGPLHTHRANKATAQVRANFGRGRQSLMKADVIPNL